MTELLSREIAFIKLNEKLDKLATNPNTTAASSPAPHSAAAQVKNETQRFSTYTKSKGQSSLLKKRGAGDGRSDAAVIGASQHGRGTAKERQTNNANPNQRTVRQNFRGTGTGSLRDTDTDSCAESHRGIRKYNKTTTSNGTTATNRTHDGTVRAVNRASTQHGRFMGTTFSVKYRNPKFVESPSLEVLIKEETASLRKIVPTSQMNIEEQNANGSSSRRSQGSNRKNQFSADGLIKFLKSKIVILEEEHERISQEMAQQKELMEKAMERQKKIEEQRDVAYDKHNAIVEQLAKVEAKLDESNLRSKERSNEQLSQHKELEIAKRELKILSQANINLEKRLYSANEELENTKNALTVMKNTERELKEGSRIECDAKDKQIKSLKKQRADLLNAYKKQLFLIDNLKRQNFCIEQSKMLGFGEKEFNKVLEWNSKAKV